MKDFLQDARANAEHITSVRRDIHQNPELGMHLPRTSALVKKELSAMGCQVHDVGPSGVVGIIGGLKPGKTILLRADMDALPMQEMSGLPFASAISAAHTCGHDTHTAMLLGAAKLLKAREADIEGRVVLMFQPGEETMEGAAAMIEAGLLRDFAPDAALAMHVAPQRPAGTFNCTHGIKMASCDKIRIVVEGTGGHGAMPTKR